MVGPFAMIVIHKQDKWFQYLLVEVAGVSKFHYNLDIELSSKSHEIFFTAILTSSLTFKYMLPNAFEAKMRLNTNLVPRFYDGIKVVKSCIWNI